MPFRHYVLPGATWAAVVIGLILPLHAAQDPPRLGATPGCRLTGRITANPGNQPLPGVDIVAESEGVTSAATSTEVDGSFVLPLNTGAYRITADLLGFSNQSQTVAVGPSACNQTLNFQLSLAPRTA